VIIRTSGLSVEEPDIPGAEASLGWYLAEGSQIIQKFHPPAGSTHANKSFHAVKRECTDKRLNFTTSTEARFALGAI
jgi:hypothetical protein